VLIIVIASGTGPSVSIISCTISSSLPTLPSSIHHLKLHLHSIRFYYNPDIPFHLKHISHTLHFLFGSSRPVRNSPAVCPRRYSVDILFCMVSRIQVATGPTTTWLSQFPLHYCLQFRICCWQFPRLYHSGTVYSLFFSMSAFGGITCLLSSSSTFLFQLLTSPRPALHPT
jgi:hypothetical protein